MFLSSLSYNQRKVFLSLAKEILAVDDGVVDHSEENYLRGLCSEMSLSFNDEMNIEEKDLITIFTDKEVKRVVLLELVALGYSNETYHISQDDYTDEIAKYLEVPIDELRHVEELLKSYKKVQNDFIQYIEK